MSEILLPRSFRGKRSEKIRPERFTFYAKHKCGYEAFWLTKRIRTPLDFDALGFGDVWFEDGQIKLVGKTLEDFRCPGCTEKIQEMPNNIKIIRILNAADYERLHREQHNETPAGQECPSCHKIRQTYETL